MRTAVSNRQESRGNQKAVFFRCLSSMFGAGVPLATCFDNLAEQATSAREKELADAISRSLREGSPLHKAMAKHPHDFSPLQIHLVQVGGQSGMLERIFHQIADYEETHRALIMKIKSNLTYPCLVFGIGLVGIALLPGLGMQNLFSILKNSGQPLPLLTRVLMIWSEMLGSLWAYGVLLLIAIVVRQGVKTAWEFPHFRAQAYELLTSVPAIKKLLRMAATLRFTRCLRLQLRAGINILSALPLAGLATGWEPTQLAAEEALDYLKHGDTLSEALARTGAFDSLLTEMVMVGEETGKLPQVLLGAVTFFERELEYVLDITTKLLEPIALGILGLICGVFILGLALPLVQLLQVLS